jgi:hypothetical protein
LQGLLEEDAGAVGSAERMRRFYIQLLLAVAVGALVGLLTSCSGDGPTAPRQQAQTVAPTPTLVPRGPVVVVTPRPHAVPRIVDPR